MRNKEKIFSAVKSALLISLIVISSYFYIPLPTSVLSLQTVFINLISLILSPSASFITVAIWLLMGAVGLPVFSAGGGIGRLLGLTGGFYWGFLISAPLMSKLKGTEPCFRRYLLSVFTGLLVEHICAVAVMGIHNDFNFLSAFTSISLPFIAGDIAKCFLSAFIGVKIVQAIKTV